MDESSESQTPRAEPSDDCDGNGDTPVLPPVVEKKDNGVSEKEQTTPSCEGGTEATDDQEKPRLEKEKLPVTPQQDISVVRTISNEQTYKILIHEKMSKVHEGMVITMGFLHCMMSLNVPAALCLTLFLWLKTVGVPRFLVTFFFTFLAIFCPSVITEVTLLMLEPPLDICENLSDYFRNTAELASAKLGLANGQGGSKKNN
tara:strand:- start:1402 stop:2007 length:606 start_codon:yes stop_codon:yes gene_type:complete